MIQVMFWESFWSQTCTVDWEVCLPLVQGNAVTRNAHSCTSTRNLRSKTVPGMTEASVNTVRTSHSRCFCGWRSRVGCCCCLFAWPAGGCAAGIRMYGMWTAELCVAGPLCRHRHTRRVICVNYLVGFCPEGPACKFMQWVCSRPALQLCFFPSWSATCQMRVLPCFPMVWRFASV